MNAAAIKPYGEDDLMRDLDKLRSIFGIKDTTAEVGSYAPHLKKETVVRGEKTKIILVDTNKAVVDAWRQFGWPNEVEILHGSVFDTRCDAVVGPANSFGFMSGGLEGALKNYFGPAIQARVRDEIDKLPAKECLVGTAFVVGTGRMPETAEGKGWTSSRYCGPSWLIVAPTMRVEGKITGSLNAYLATRAALQAAPKGITVAIPGMGAGAGGLDPAICAKQMHEAINEVLGNLKPPADSVVAQDRHRTLAGGSAADPWGNPTPPAYTKPAPETPMPWRASVLMS